MARRPITDFPVADAHLNLDAGGHRHCVALVYLRFGKAVVSRAGSRYGMDWAKPIKRASLFEVMSINVLLSRLWHGFLGDFQPISYDHETRKSRNRRVLTTKRSCRDLRMTLLEALRLATFSMTQR